jgi:hypothetical protein
MGSVTNPAGSVSGHSLTGLVDAYAGNYGGSALALPPQWQHVVLLSDKTGACSREGSGGSYAASELTLRFTFVGTWNNNGQLPPIPPPAADLPLVFDATGTTLVTSDGVTRQVIARFMQASSGGKAGRDITCTGPSSITITRADDMVADGAHQYEGSYDLHFGTDHVTGSFVAPWC